MISINGANQITEQVSEQVVNDLTFFQQYMLDLQQNMLSFVFKFFFACIVLVIGVLVIKLITKGINRGLDKAAEKNGFAHMRFIEDTIKFLLYFILILLIAQYFGVTTASVIAILTSAGVAIGLAFQGALSNFAGGILLLIQRPFKIGDYVIIGAGSCEGIVADIGIIYTTIEIANQKTIVVPNGSLANNTITNLTMNGSRFLEIIFDIAYNSDIATAKSIIEEIAKSDEKVLKDKDISVFVSSLEDSSIKIGLRVCVPQDYYITTKWRLLEQIKVELDRGGINIPYNQLDVHIKNP